MKLYRLLDATQSENLSVDDLTCLLDEHSAVAAKLEQITLQRGQHQGPLPGHCPRIRDLKYARTVIAQ
jgi:hypothetical protein